MGAKPDFRLKIFNKENNRVCNDAGCGYKNEKGYIRIYISPGVVLKDDDELVYTLFPPFEKEEKDDDIPF